MFAIHAWIFLVTFATANGDLPWTLESYETRRECEAARAAFLAYPQPDVRYISPCRYLDQPEWEKTMFI